MKVFTLYLLAVCFSFELTAQQLNKGKVLVLYTPGHPANKFIPLQNIGGALDGHESGDINHMLTAQNLKAMRSVGLKPVSYRLRTELSDEVWHWNPSGKWSEAGKHQGYWISDSVSAKPIMVSYGYHLPRRGNTIDQANDDGYSRIADGNDASFWKSNPYLDKYFTKESNSIHPQWVIVDLGKLQDVNAVSIKWGKPYALSFIVDYALDIGSDYFEPFRAELWHSFPGNRFDNPKGGNKVIKLFDKPINIRFIRISMMEGSYTSANNSSDIRDKLGFAVRELEVGVVDSIGKFHDLIHHIADHNKQSTIYVSSTDSWHSAKDIDLMVEQTGLDRFFLCGITAGQPPLMPAGLLYDTPENVGAMIKYLKAKHYRVNEVELGEEPEGQLISPVDYATLYFQWGTMITRLSPAMRMGGPGFATLSFIDENNNSFSEAKWTNIFLEYLKNHNAINLFNFFSFEWYPFDDICAPTTQQLAIAPQMLTMALNNLYRNSLTPNTPVYLTEYGYSAYGGRAEVEIEGALMYADIVGKFLELGGSKCFLYGYEPAYLEQTNNCDYGNNILFGLGDKGEIKFKTAAYYGMQMLTHYWAQPFDSVLKIYPAISDIVNQKEQPLVTAYALYSPGRKWSVLLINKDPLNTISVELTFQNTITKQFITFQPQQIIQYSNAQYHWINDGANGHPSLSLPPTIKSINGLSPISLPPYSMSVLRE